MVHSSDCYSLQDAEDANCNNEGDVWYNFTCTNNSYIETFNKIVQECNDITGECLNKTLNEKRDELENLTKSQVSSSEEYFK